MELSSNSVQCILEEMYYVLMIWLSSQERVSALCVVLLSGWRHLAIAHWPLVLLGPQAPLS